MNTEFHFYATYLIAARAGFTPDEAQKIAYAAEYVDENGRQICINKGMVGEYRNTQSQAFELDDIPSDKAEQVKIYSIFHFIPGNPEHKGAARKDNLIHPLNTTPNSANAQKIFEQALKSDDLYRIGIAAHGYVDTWAHQNFVGCMDGFNSIPGVDIGDGFFKWALPDLGHADAMHDPDFPAAVWIDPRLKEERVENRLRFLEAAESLFWMLRVYKSRDSSPDKISSIRDALIADLNAIWKDRDDSRTKSAERIGRYRDLSARPEYGAKRIEMFNKNLWFDAAIDKRIRRGDDERTAGRAASGGYDYFWRDLAKHSSTDWLLFQDAVKKHQQETISILTSAVPAFKDILEGTDQAHSSPHTA